jgi:hypothetical protein
MNSCSAMHSSSAGLPPVLLTVRLYLEVGHYSTILFLSSHFSEAWVLYIPATSIILYWSKFNGY